MLFRLVLLAFLCLACFEGVVAQSKAESEVVALLQQQAADWNRGDIDAFMEGYWKSDELVFIGSRGPTFGWQKTLENYKKGYPDLSAMGKLSFDLISVTQQSKKVVSVVGKFTLEREHDQPTGHFLLLVKKIKGTWKVIADHTS